MDAHRYNESMQMRVTQQSERRASPRPNMPIYKQPKCMHKWITSWSITLLKRISTCIKCNEVKYTNAHKS